MYELAVHTENVILTDKNFHILCGFEPRSPSQTETTPKKLSLGLKLRANVYIYTKNFSSSLGFYLWVSSGTSHLSLYYPFSTKTEDHTLPWIK